MVGLLRSYKLSQVDIEECLYREYSDAKRSDVIVRDPEMLSMNNLAEEKER